jgi:shikimate dehydrogenase
VVGLLNGGIQEIVVANRNRGRAEKLATDLAGLPGGNRIAPVSLAEARPADLGPGDLLLSATPLGLQGAASWPWDLGGFDRGVLVYDMAYGKRETPLVEQARGSGFRAASGRRMLLCQGAAAFSLWTGAPAPLKAMERALDGAIDS